ncbi:MAG: VWA domain-containing protein [Planctomycetota bacterium]
MNLSFIFSAAAQGSELSTTTRFVFQNAPPLWVVFLVIIPALLILVAGAYGFERGAPRRDVTKLAILRFIALGCLLAILFRPALETFQYRTQRTIVPVLIDDSASMRRSDSYTNDTDRNQLIKALGMPSGDSAANHTRASLAARAVTTKLEPALKDLGYDVRLYRFSDEVAPITSANEIEGRGDRTRIGDALFHVLEDHRGRATPMILISDGRNTDGRDPREAARFAAVEGMSIFTVGVGDPSAPSNLSVEIVEAPDVALENDEVVVTVRVNAAGIDSAIIPVLLVAEDGEGGEIETLTNAEATFTSGSGPSRVTLRFTPRQIGELRIAVKVPPRSDEALVDDNIVRRTIQVKPEKIRVLYIEGNARWEYRYLKNTLLRADKNLIVHCFLTSAGRDFVQETTKGQTPLLDLPSDRQMLLENYDVVIFGDVPPDRLGPTRDDRDRFLEALRDFVRRGGGFLMIAGEYDSPRSYAGTPIQELLPIELAGPEDEALLPREQKEEFFPKLENPTNPHDLVRLIENPDDNRRLWEEPNGLRGQFWFCPVKKSKPGAEVLLRHPEFKNRYGNIILAATTFVPEGRSMFLGFDSTWRWRYVYGDRYFEQFWRRSIRYLALNRLKSGDRRYSLAVERNVFELNDRAALEARVLDDSFQPSRNANQAAFVRALRSGKVTPVPLEPAPGEPGTFRSAFVVNEEGRYEAWITRDDTEGGKRVASVEFESRLPDRENREPMLDAATLRAIASISAGDSLSKKSNTDHYFPLAKIDEVAARFPGGGAQKFPEPSEFRDLWDQWWTLLILVAALAAEWALRKRSQLI